MEYWALIENPTGETYHELINLLCDYSDTFYFMTRKELKYKPEILAKFEPFMIETYQTKEWVNTETKGPAATVYMSLKLIMRLVSYCNNLRNRYMTG